MFDKNKRHGFVVVEYTGNGMMYLKNGNEYEGVISRSKSAIVINNDGTWSVIGRRDYKIIHDLRAPVKIGEEAEFSDDGKNWQQNTYRTLRLDSDYPFITNKEAWRYIRAIQKPSIEITVKVNGKEAKPSELSEESWLNIRKEN